MLQQLAPRVMGTARPGSPDAPADRVDEGRTMLRSLGAVLLLAVVAWGDARAGDERATFIVSATVPARVAIEAVEQPSRLVISPDDVRRGYKDVSARYAVSQNTERGWVLQLAPRIGITQQVEVRGLAMDVVLREESVEVYRPATVGREDISLEYRLVLDTDAEPGTYDMPVHVAATPL
jgi:hypothetical protein